MKKVAKFGGTSLATAEQVRKVLNIVRSDSSRRIVVVSAPGKRTADDTKVTDLLIACAKAALAGKSADDEVSAVAARYAEIAAGLGLAADFGERVAEDLRRRLAGPRDPASRFTDLLKAAGEDHCARLVAEALEREGVRARYVSPVEAGLLLSSEFGNAQVLEESYGRLAKLADATEVIVFPGFFGVTREGEIATLPRGGSDTTGAILAAAVDADEYENFTDVDSVFAVDPRIYPEAPPIPLMTYREMRELSYAGFSVFHDEAIIPVVRAGIPIHIRNTNRPEAPGTRIAATRPYTAGEVIGIAGSDGFSTVFVEKYMMNREIGFGRRLAQIFETEGIPYEHQPSGIDSISTVIRSDLLPPKKEAVVVERIRQELQPDDVAVEHGLALIMLVGEGMRYTVGMAARATGALAKAGVNIEMINQGSSEISVMFGVKDVDRRRAVLALAQEFLRPRRRAPRSRKQT